MTSDLRNDLGHPSTDVGSTAKHGGGRTRRIVVALDNSRSGWDAFFWAAGEAHRSGGRLVIFHATPTLDWTFALAAIGPVPFDYHAARTSHAALTAELRREVIERTKELGLDAEFVCTHGPPARALRSYVRTNKPDVIVIGRSMRLRHRIIGSLGQRLLARRTAAVLIVVP